MISSMSLRVFNFAAIFCVASITSAAEYTDNQLLEIGREAIRQRAEAKGAEREKEAFRKALQGLSDSQKIRAVAYRVLDSDNNPKYAMKSSNSMVAAYALGQDQQLISDWSTLREMLREEKNPRKFYLLSGLTPWTRGDKRHDFVFEFTHMLFADGRVAKDEGEYTREYAHDVSEYAYQAIVNSLRALGADFEPPPKDLPHEQQALILAKWLKANWPRCRDIEIPPRLSGEKPGLDIRKPSAHRRGKSPSRQIPARPREADENDTTAENRLPRIISGVLLVGIVVLVLKIWKGRGSC